MAGEETPIEAAKAEARRAAHAARAGAHATGPNAAAQAHLRAALAGYETAPLAGYIPMRTEIDPLPVMKAHEGPVGVPVIRGRGLALAFRRWQPGCAMIDGGFGTLIPAEDEPLTPRVVIVPLLAFDARGFRLGYGGGFYDRTLAGLRADGAVLAIGFAYSAQAVAQLPVNRFDQRLDAVVTEDGVIRFSS